MTDFAAAVVGCGMFGGLYEDFEVPRIYSHGKGYAMSPAFGRLAFVDPNAARVSALAAKAGGTAFGAVAEMMDGFAPDVVSIVTPDDTHVDVARTVMNAARPPKLLFMEKPVSRTEEELDSLEALARTKNVAVIVNHSRRFDSAYASLARRIRDGAYGKLVRVHVDIYGGWRHLAVHMVDLLHYFFGEPLQIDRANYAAPSRYEGDPTLDVEGRIGGAPVRFVGFDEGNYQLLEVSLYFTGGLVRLPDFGNRIEVFEPEINAENERVLVLDDGVSGPAMTDAMPRAIETIADYLWNPVGFDLTPWGLGEARRTMNCIWQGMNVYAAQSV